MYHGPKYRAWRVVVRVTRVDGSEMSLLGPVDAEHGAYVALQGSDEDYRAQLRRDPSVVDYATSFQGERIDAPGEWVRICSVSGHGPALWSTLAAR